MRTLVPLAAPKPAPAITTELSYQPITGYAAAAHDHDVATGTSDGFISSADKVKLDGIEAGAQVNQDAFSYVKVGDTTIAADKEKDTLELVASTNITITPDAASKKVTLSVDGGNQASLSPTGYVKIPVQGSNNPLIIQWGTFTTNGSPSYGDLAIPFPNAFLSVTGNVHGGNNTFSTSMSPSGLTQVVVYGFLNGSPVPNGYYVSYLAIGY